MADLEHELKLIRDRNKRVETDKAWERSFTRRGFIAVITYLTASLFLWSAGMTQPFLSALVPTGGYILSTLSLPWIKKWWMS